MHIRFACGHDLTLGDNPSGAPVCSCGETRVQSVKARAPRFTGACSGPYAEFKNLGPAVVNLAPAGPLVLKKE
jgi:hypothetical protein